MFHLADQLAAAPSPASTPSDQSWRPGPRHPPRTKAPVHDDVVPEILSTLEKQAIELPSWAFGNSGTRFRVFPTAGTPRDPFEKIADAAEVNRLTALAPTVALHIRGTSSTTTRPSAATPKTSA